MLCFMDYIYPCNVLCGRLTADSINSPYVIVLPLYRLH